MSGKKKIENDDVVVIQLADLQAVFAEIGGVDDETVGLKHQFDAFRCRAIVFNEQHAHGRISAAVRITYPINKG